MSDQPLVSIIIPTYNRAHLIGETLDSVLAQTYQNWECIIVDDGSSDNSDEVIEEYTKKDTRFKNYHRPEEHLPGGNGARNYGFKMSQGEYIQWFDSDDLMDNDYLNFKVNNIRDNDILITSGRIKDVNNNCRDLRMSFKKKYSLYKEMVTYNSEILTPTLFFKREIFHNTNLFDESIKRGQETEFFARLFFENSLKHSFIDKQNFTYRIVADSKSSQSQQVFFNSRMKYFLDNLDRSLVLNDSYLFNRFYKKVMSTLFDFIKIRDKRSFTFNFSEFLKIKKKHKLKVKFLDVLKILNLTGFHSEKLRKFYINQLDK
jgi:glycosyltransferase involved in cell wall biosynthesis